MAKVIELRKAITSIDEKEIYRIPVLIGAPKVLVSCRQLRNKYETNRDIKTWSAWFLLKALTTSNHIKNWRSQRDLILPFLQVNEKTFYSLLHKMTELGLVTTDSNFNIFLISYEKAADLLDIVYGGTYSLPYNPINEHGFKQTFQYIIRAEEFKHQQERQLSALLYHLGKNPSLKNDLHVLLVKYGADGHQLHDGIYFQERLLSLQMRLFKEGSEILQYVLTHRADINRGVKSIKRNHSYKSTQSVSYLKSRMFKMGIITVEKKKVESQQRSRLYVPDVEARGGKRDGYKYNRRSGNTVWFLTDQINLKYETVSKKTGEGKRAKVA